MNILFYTGVIFEVEGEEMLPRINFGAVFEVNQLLYNFSNTFKVLKRSMSSLTT